MIDSAAQSRVAVYETCNNAFRPAVTWRVDGGNLWIESPTASLRVVKLSDVREIRLEFAPTRPERNRYRCRITLSGGRTETIFNRTYLGVMDFRDTSAAYRTFLAEFLPAVVHQSPGCVLVAGTSGINYALGVVGSVFVAGVILAVFIFAIVAGVWWLVFLKLALMVFYLPTVWRWLRRNRSLAFDPGRPPEAVLPKLSSAL